VADGLDTPVHVETRNAVPWVGQPVPHAGHVPQSLDRQPVALPDGSGVDPDQHRIGGDDRRVDVFELEGIRWARGEQGRGWTRTSTASAVTTGVSMSLSWRASGGPEGSKVEAFGPDSAINRHFTDSGNAWVHFRAPDGNICEFTQDPGISRPHERGP
jgi:hypothetical protein